MSRLPASRYVLALLTAGTGLAIDLISKAVVFDTLGYPDMVSPWVYEVLNGRITFRLFTSFNEGALWGIGQGLSWLFALLSIVAVIAIVYWLFVAGAATSRWLTVSLSFIVAGTLGNLYDRLGLHGYVDVDGERLYAVRDFLLFTFGRFAWPVFNFADVWLVTGAVMLALASLKPGDAPPDGGAAKPASTGSSSQESTPRGSQPPGSQPRAK